MRHSDFSNFLGLNMNTADLKMIASTLTPVKVCAELLALSIVEQVHCTGSEISVSLSKSGGCISDTGRGIRLEPDDGYSISHAELALTTYYPCFSENSKVDDVLSDLIWGQHGSMGPALANYACKNLTYLSRRSKQIWEQSYAYGLPMGAPKKLGSTLQTGTEIHFQTNGEIEIESFESIIRRIKEKLPDFKIHFSASKNHE